MSKHVMKEKNIRGKSEQYNFWTPRLSVAFHHPWQERELKQDLRDNLGV